jgi:hypothetical protein
MALGKHHLRFAGRKIGMPGTKLLRTLLGVALILGGIFSFLPILGLWMLPLGLLVLSIDHHRVRRLRRRIDVWWARRKRRRRSQAQPPDSPTKEKRAGCDPAPKALGNGGVSSREDEASLPE